MFGDDVMGRLADGRSLPSVVTVERPRTQYADAGDVTIAYCRSGSGPIDVVVMPPFATHLELMWEPPFNGRFFDRFARFARVAQIDKRGVGLADRMSEPATLEERMDDLRAVMDAEGIERAAIVGISDGASMSALDMDFTNDTRSALPVISAPTLIIHRSGDPILRRERAVALAELIPGARRVELPGDWHLSLVDDEEIEALDIIEEFITGSRPAPGIDIDRLLATGLFTDIVDSTPRAAELGDRRWRELLDAHDVVAAAEIDRHRGIMVKTTGDGVLARFDGPVRGIRCARAIVDAADRLDLRLRAGLHVGEFLLRGNDLPGIKVHMERSTARNSAPVRSTCSKCEPLRSSPVN